MCATETDLHHGAKVTKHKALGCISKWCPHFLQGETSWRRTVLTTKASGRLRECAYVYV